MQNSINFYSFARNTRRANKLNANNRLIMIEELISNILNTTLNNFDIPFCIATNIGTYLIIKSIEDIRKNIIGSVWRKRIIFLLVSIILGVLYCLDGANYKIIINSIILAPVSWSWIFKPICAKLNIDYKQVIKDTDKLD